MLVRHVFVVGLLAAIGCQSSSPPVDFNCPDSEIAQWEIPAGSLDRSLTPEQAYNKVLTGSLPIDGIRDRWQELADRWRSGDQYWAYTLEEEQLINDVGDQEGVVLIRGCQQLGYLATSAGLADERLPPQR